MDGDRATDKLWGSYQPLSWSCGAQHGPSLYINQYEPETNESGSGQSARRVTVGGDGWRPHTNCYHTGVFLLLANPMFHGNTLLIVIWTSNMQNRISKNISRANVYRFWKWHNNGLWLRGFILHFILNLQIPTLFPSLYINPYCENLWALETDIVSMYFPRILIASKQHQGLEIPTCKYSCKI